MQANVLSWVTKSLKSSGKIGFYPKLLFVFEGLRSRGLDSYKPIKIYM